MRAMDQETSPLGFTGERVLPDEPEWAWCFQAHKFGYDDLVARVEPGARVLDVGCGEGYGADLLARDARWVVACDYAQEAVAHARARYGRDNIAWVVCDAERLPFASGTFDVVSSLQVIEHLRDTERHLVDVARVLREEGWHYVATPNIDQMSEAERNNPWHLTDFTTQMLADALRRRFEEVEVVGMFYRAESPRVRAMHEAEATEEIVRTRLDRVERLLARLPGPVRVKMRPVARSLAGIPKLTPDEARNAILAEDFEARAPADESFCLIGIARRPRR
jgi:ubiquinone/menaquinone biosynthesis C-methylase UbiE